MTHSGQLLRPAELVAYLRSHGWRVADDGYEGGALWEKTDDRGTQEVFVPMAEEAPDYGHVVQRLISEREPFGRRVTATLSTALAASIRASRAAITNGDLSVFDETIQAGVSSNLCRALASVRGPVAVAMTLEVQMRWAHLRGHTPPSEGAFFFGADTLEVLDSAASHLRDQEEELPENQTIYGVVTKCERGAVANSGSILVEGWVEGEPPTRVSCHVQLAGEEYDAAARAHAERKLVALVGTTHRVGRRWTVDQVDSFSTETDVEQAD